MTYVFGIFRRSKRGAHRAIKRVAYCYGEHLELATEIICQTRKSRIN